MTLGALDWLTVFPCDLPVNYGATGKLDRCRSPKLPSVAPAWMCHGRFVNSVGTMFPSVALQGLLPSVSSQPSHSYFACSECEWAGSGFCVAVTVYFIPGSQRKVDALCGSQNVLLLSDNDKQTLLLT